MEEKIERLRESIKSNQNLTEEFKCNLGTLTDLLVTVFPNFDYSNYERLLPSLSIYNDDAIVGYSLYDVENNRIGLNTKKIFEDRLDLQHLFLNNMLYMGTKLQSSELLEGYTKGLTEVISSTINYDESMKKPNILESTLLSIFSKVVNPEMLLDSYFNGSMDKVVLELESYGVDKEDFTKLLGTINKVKDGEKENSAFTDAEVIMVGMYAKKVDTNLRNGELAYDDISSKYDDFASMLIFEKSELISMYPHHDFSNITGFKNVNIALESAVINSEIIEQTPVIK